MAPVPAARSAPDLRSPARFLLWVARAQRSTVVGGACFGVLWMGAQAVVPSALGEAVQAVQEARRAPLVAWALVLLGLGILQAAAGVLRHRRAVMNFVIAASRIDLLVADHATRCGADLAQHVAAGEIASLGANDVERIGDVMDVTARFTGAVVSYTAVAVLMLVRAPLLGAVLLVGAAVAVAAVAPLMRPLERRQSVERDVRAEASSLAADTVVGLRILRGLGGEATFLSRFVAASQRLRAASVRTAVAQSNLDALQVLLPGVLLVTVTFLAAREALAGHLDVGQLVSFYAYTAFIVLPMRTITEMASKWAAGTVAAGRVIEVLRREPAFSDPEAAAPAPPAGELLDELTGFRAPAGLLTVAASADPGAAEALADRLGRFADLPAGTEVRLGGVPLRLLPLEEVRRRILVVESEPILLAGTVRELLAGAAGGPPGSAADPAAVEAALLAACATDVVEGLPDGLDTELPERARTLSGGQRQRLVLAQALLADPEVLVLVEPTSAVDAHTEALVAARLKAARAGRTTIVMSTSPLVLEQADRVVVLDGSLLAEGTHRELLAGDPRYHELVTRGLAS